MLSFHYSIKDLNKFPPGILSTEIELLHFCEKHPWLEWDWEVIIMGE